MPPESGPASDSARTSTVSARPGPDSGLPAEQLFARTSVVTSTARALAEDHIPAAGTDLCRRCGEPAPCATAIHAAQVIRLSALGVSAAVRPADLAIPTRVAETSPATATGRLGLFDE